jgi:parallel beta-helix repeat protein
MGRMKIFRKILSVAMVFILLFGSIYQVLDFISQDSGGIDISGGHLLVNTTWTKSNSPYRINGDLVVDFDFTLTIEPGVEIEFTDDYYLYVEGNLTVTGTPVEHVVFTSSKGSPSPGDWNSIRVNSTGHVKMNYCDISYGNNAVYIFGSSENKIENTTVSNGKGHGIFVRYSSYTSIKNSDIYSNMLNGVNLLESSYIEIIDSTCYDNSFEGISLSGSSFTTIINSQFYSNEGSGIHLFSASNVSIVNNPAYQNMNFGITVKSSENVEIEDSDIYSNWEDGIFLSDSSFISIDLCTIYDHKNGIYMFNSYFVEIKNSNIYDNKESGSVLIDSSNNIIDNLNVYSNKNYGIYLTKDPINQKGSSFNSISNIQIWDNLYGIFIRFSRNNSIENAYVHTNVNAILAPECNYLKINNSNISNNDYYAISLIGTSNSKITNNELFNNYYGIFLQPPSYHNIMHHNTIKDHIYYSSDTSSLNQWDDGSEGNYWGNYDGIDSDFDGIGDEPYLISTAGEDRYPLVDFNNTVFKILGSMPANESNLVPLSSTIKFFLSEGAVTQTFMDNITITPSTSIVSYDWEDSDKNLTLSVEPMLLHGKSRRYDPTKGC